MEAIKQIVADAKADNNLRVAVFVDTLAMAVVHYEQSEGMRRSFRKAASDLALEAGIIGAPVKHDEVAKSCLQDIYFLQLLAESELRMRTISTGYERLRAAAIAVLEVDNTGFNNDDYQAMAELRKALDNDLK